MTKETNYNKDAKELTVKELEVKIEEVKNHLQGLQDTLALKIVLVGY